MINYIKYILIFFWFSIYSQEIPPIQSFQPDDYDADIQNWMITQSDDGSIVVANSSGILTYNGFGNFMSLLITLLLGLSSTLMEIYILEKTQTLDLV